MKKMILISFLLLVAMSSVFATIDVSSVDSSLSLPTDVKNVMTRSVRLVYIVGIIAAVLAVLLLGITTILGISVSDKLKTTLLRIFLGIAIMALATYIVNSLGVVGGGVKGTASGAIVQFAPSEVSELLVEVAEVSL